MKTDELNINGLTDVLRHWKDSLLRLQRKLDYHKQVVNDRLLESRHIEAVLAIYDKSLTNALARFNALCKQQTDAWERGYNPILRSDMITRIQLAATNDMAKLDERIEYLESSVEGYKKVRDQLAKEVDEERGKSNIRGAAIIRASTYLRSPTEKNIRLAKSLLAEALNTDGKSALITATQAKND